MNDLTITCPHCHLEIALSEAVAHRLREQISGEFAARLEAQQRTFAERDLQLREQKAQLDQARQSVDQQVADKLVVERAQLIASARQSAEQKVSVDLQDLRNRLVEQGESLQKAQQGELTLRKQQRELEDQKRSFELEMARQLDEERGKIREAAKLQAVEEQRLPLMEKERLISDLQKQIEVLKQKAEQGSVQLQGEVLELDIEDRLRALFVTDSIEPVAKGVRGADILQRVRTSAGRECGSILWETKRTKAFGKDWVAKIKGDQRAACADFAVIVTQTMPPEFRSFGPLEGIWVCEFACALPLAAALRQGLVSLAGARQAETGKRGKMEQLFQFLSGLEFRQRIEALVEGFIVLQQQIDQEKRALARHWAVRQKQLESMLQHTTGLVGSIEGIMGQNALPKIAPLQLDASNDSGEQVA